MKGAALLPKSKNSFGFLKQTRNDEIFLYYATVFYLLSWKEQHFYQSQNIFKKPQSNVNNAN